MKPNQINNLKEIKKFVILIGIEALIIVFGLLVGILSMASNHVSQSNIYKFSQMNFVILAVFLGLIYRDISELTTVMKQNREIRLKSFMGQSLSPNRIAKLIVFPILSIVTLSVLYGNLNQPEKIQKRPTITIENREQISGTSSSVLERFKNIPSNEK